MANLVAIVGRPNVGKSTLFNRLTKTRQAIVSDVAGTTRDRQYGKCDWNGKEFSVVDTGGWVVKSDDIFEEEIRKQVLIATEEADLILFLVDITTGVTDWDMDVAQILRRTKLPVILVANKTDNNDLIYNAAEFYKLGLGGWDGTYKGNPVKQGVYYVQVTAKGADGRRFNIKKDVNLLRTFDNTVE